MVSNGYRFQQINEHLCDKQQYTAIQQNDHFLKLANGTSNRTIYQCICTTPRKYISRIFFLFISNLNTVHFIIEWKKNALTSDFLFQKMSAHLVCFCLILASNLRLTFFDHYLWMLLLLMMMIIIYDEAGDADADDDEIEHDYSLIIANILM